MTDHDLTSGFAAMRELEPTDEEVAEALARVAARPHRIRARWWRIGSGAALPAAGALAAVAVAAVVLALAHGRPPSPAVSSASPAAARGLVARLGVLRRLQTAADRSLPSRSWAPSVARRRAPASPPSAVVPGLTRLVGSLGGQRLFLVVGRPGLSALFDPGLGDQAALVLATKGGLVPRLGVPAADLYDPFNAWRFGSYLAGLFPDGVARVIWTIRLPDGRTRTVRAEVADNVALAHDAEGGWVIAARWYASDGRAVATSVAVLTRALERRRAEQYDATVARAERTHNPIARALTAGFAVFAQPVSQTRGLMGAEAGLTVSRPPIARMPIAVISPVYLPAADLQEVRLVTTTGGLSLWIVPNDDTVCVVQAEPVAVLAAETAQPLDQSSTGICARSMAAVAREGLIGSTRLPGGPAVIYGIAPRTNSTVTLTLTGGSREAVPVVDGVFVAARAGVSAITVRGVDGRPTTTALG